MLNKIKISLKIIIPITTMIFCAFLVLGFRDGEFSWNTRNIIMFRLPIVAIIIFGAGGASMGTYMIHLLTKNKATDIGTIGLNSMNLLVFTILIHQLSLSSFSAISGTILPIMYFFSSLGISLLIYVMTYRHKVSSNKIIILGIIMSMVISAFTYLLRTQVSLSVAAAILSKSIGGVEETSSYFSQISTYTQYVISAIAIVMTVIFFNKIRIVSTDEVKANTLGINVRNIRLVMLIIASLGATLSFISLGNLMLLGFMATNIVYLFWRNKNFMQFLLVIIVGITSLLFIYFIMHSMLGITVRLGVTVNAIAVPYLILVLLKGGNNGIKNG